MSAEIYISYSGKFSDRGFWAFVDGEDKKVRHAAVMLYQDMRTRQQQAGNEPTAGVWIGGKAFEPTIAELEEHDERVRLVLDREKSLPDSLAELAMSLSPEELAEVVEQCPDESELQDTTSLERSEPPPVVDDFDIDFDF